MSDLIETMREAINERVAGTAMIQACYLEAACEKIERLEHELAECNKFHKMSIMREFESCEDGVVLAAQVLQMREALEKYGRHVAPFGVCACLKHSDNLCDCGFDEALAFDTKPAESVINAVKAQALREAAKACGIGNLCACEFMADELDQRCRKCGGNMIYGKAIQQTLTGSPDFPGDTRGITMSPGGSGKLIDCLKCEKCGWSVTE